MSFKSQMVLMAIYKMLALWLFMVNGVSWTRLSFQAFNLGSAEIVKTIAND